MLIEIYVAVWLQFSYTHMYEQLNAPKTKPETFIDVALSVRVLALCRKIARLYACDSNDKIDNDM